jgi:hypothetical protein
MSTVANAFAVVATIDTTADSVTAPFASTTAVSICANPTDNYECYSYYCWCFTVPVPVLLLLLLLLHFLTREYRLILSLNRNFK